MKKIIFAIFTISIIFQSCGKHESLGDNYDLSNTLAPYVTLTALPPKL